MSRTYRRNQPHLIREHCGGRNEARHNPWLMPDCYRHLPFEEAYRRYAGWFTRDHPVALYGIPRWYILLHYTKPRRQYDRLALLRCIRRDEWDDYLPYRYRRVDYGYW